jgi:hypothetical protein
MSTPIRLSVRSTVDLLAVVPYLLGFHPTDSLVVVAMRAGQMVFAARADLPGPRSSGATRAALADQLARVVVRQDAQTASVLGYGPPDLVTAALPAVCDALSQQGVEIFDALRVTAGRYWSFVCADPECCPPDGTPFDVTTSRLTAEAVFAGQAVLPDRTALTRLVAPVRGLPRELMRQAAERAVDRLAALVVAEPTADPTAGPVAGPVVEGGAVRSGGGAAAVLRAGKAAVRDALARGETGAGLTDDEVAWLTLLLSHRPVRDFAWERTTPDEWQIALWTEVLRRAAPELAPAPASLLAFAAWRSGHGALASVALERALGADPAYPMALLLDDMLRRGVPPSTLDGWPAVEQPVKLAGTGPAGASGRRRRRRRRGRRSRAGGQDATG